MVKICTAPAHHWGTRAGVPDGGSGRQQAVARRGSECGKRVNESGRDCFTSFITVAARLSVAVASLPGTNTSCQPPPKQTNHFRSEEQPKREEEIPPLMPPHSVCGGPSVVTFQHPAP